MINVLDMGITCVSWATVISAILSCFIMSYWIWGKKDLFLHLSPKNFSLERQIVIDELLVAVLSTLETVILSALSIIINLMLVMVDGSTSVAVYTASMRIIQFSMIPLIDIGTSVITVAGVAYGARNVENLKVAYSYSIKLGFALSIVIGALIILFSSNISSIFSYTASSAALAHRISIAVSILSLSVLAVPHILMSSMLFRGVGKGINSLILTLLRSLILESLFPYLFCFVFGWGLVDYMGVGNN